MSASTLLIVGSAERPVIAMNEDALRRRLRAAWYPGRRRHSVVTCRSGSR
jgi:hypothetical protein